MVLPKAMLTTPGAGWVLSPRLDWRHVGRLVLALLLFAALSQANLRAADFKPVLDGNGDLVAAKIVATDAPYNADNTGKADASGALQKALNDITWKYGGGVLYLPTGRYRLEKSLVVPQFATLYGDWKKPTPGQPLSGTVLLAYADKGNPTGKALLTNQDNLGYGNVYNLSIYYPDQDPKNPIPYPFSIDGKTSYVHNVTLVNSYQGIMMSDFSGGSVSDVYGCVLSRGLVLKSSTELCSVYNVQFDSSYWSKLPEASMTAGNASRVKEFMASKLIGLQIGKVDGLSLYNADLQAAKTPLLVMMEEDEQKVMDTSSNQYGFGGGCGKVLGRRTDVGTDAWYFGTHYFDLDNYPDLTDRTYTFATMRHAAKTSLSDVYQASMFGVKADGNIDDAAALQKALDTAGAAGGGTVMLPHGTTLVKAPLTVPSGVELRGGNLPVELRPWAIVTALVLDCGQDTATPATAQAGITLAPGSGIRGIVVCEANNFWELDADGNPTAHAYPYTIRGGGKNVYVYDSTFPNAYNMIDLNANRCDDAQVVNVWGAAGKTGIFVGGGSQDVKLENVNIDIGPLWSDPRRKVPFTSKILGGCQKILSRDSTTFVFGDCTRLSTFDLAGFAPYRFMEFIDQGNGGAAEASFWSSVFDVPTVETVRLRGARSVDFLGLFATGGFNGYSNCFEADPSFAGKVNLYGQCFENTLSNHSYSIGADHLNIHLEHSLTTGRKIVDVSSVEVGSNAQNAVDGFPDTLWETKEVPGIHSLTLQLDEPSIATRFRLHCAGDYANRLYNTRDASLEGSADGKKYFELASFTGNIKNWVDVPVVSNAPVRFVRLLIQKAQAPGEIWNRSFVANVDVFGYPARLASSITPASDFAAARQWSKDSGFNLAIETARRHFKNKEYAEADRFFTLANALASGDHVSVASALYGKGQVLKATGKDAEARGLFARASNLLAGAKPSDSKWLEYVLLNADVLQALDRIPEAVSFLHASIRAAPDNAKTKIQEKLDDLESKKK